jgi:nucleoid-associated protein YgaU
MAKVQGNSSAAGKRLSVWLFLSVAIAAALGALHFKKETVDWQRKFAGFREWLFEEPHPQAMPARKPAPPAILPPDFDLAYVGEDGKLVAAGRGEPGWTVRLQSETASLGDVKADENGEWVITQEQPLPPGHYNLSLLETGPEGQNAVPGLRKVPFTVAPRSQGSRAAEPMKQASLQGPSKAAPAQTEPQAAENSSRQSDRGSTDCTLATVKPGDTLWEMAHRCYGDGTRYSKIYQSNQALIHDPNRIYPDQHLTLPR